jgi:hypothetical protein
MKHILLLLLISLLPAARPAQAQTRTVPEINVAYIDAMKTELQSLRGLEYTAPVTVQFVSQKEIADIAAGIMVREGMGADYIDASARVMQAFGFLESTGDLQAALDSVLTQQVEGLYDTDQNTLYVVRENLLAEQAQELMSIFNGMNPKDFALSHELEHALQAQHFDLNRLNTLRVRSEDAALAYKCVVEGDAMAVMMNYTMRAVGANVLETPNMGALMQGMMDTPGASALGEFPDVPEVIKAQFLFPYTGGLDLLGVLYQDGGWDAVNNAFENPPLSSEQVLHPEKYLDERDDPVDLDLGDMSAHAPPDSKFLDSNVLGEFHVRLLLKITGPPGDEPDWAEPAAGWDGDRFAAYAAPGGHTILFWATAWDTAPEAAEFFDAYSAALTHRFGPAKQAGEDTAQNTWDTPCGPALLARDKDRVALVQCAERAAAPTAMRALLTAPAAPLTQD